MPIRFLQRLWICALPLAALIHSSIASSATPPIPSAQTVVDALARANAAVVEVKVRAASDARSAATLGRVRNGSGGVIGPDGLILTIGYLVLEAESVQVVTQDGKTLPARTVAYDLATGFGLIQPLVPMRGVAAVPLGSQRDMGVGEPMMAATGGAEGDVHMTQLVSKRAFSGYWEYHIESALFTSPPIGNHSGAPVFNLKGELMGIGSLFVMDTQGDGQRSPGNMFVPVDLLKPILRELQQKGGSAASRRPWLGLTSSEQGGRITIVRVNPESPALAGGLRPGDVVLEVDGEKVTTLEAFYKKLWQRAKPDDEVKLTVLQGAEIKAISIKAVDRMSTLKQPSGI